MGRAGPGWVMGGEGVSAPTVALMASVDEALTMYLKSDFSDQLPPEFLYGVCMVFLGHSKPPRAQGSCQGCLGDV